VNARTLREAIRNAQLGAPALASGNATGSASGAGGSAGGVELADVFLAKITQFTGSGTSIRYGFKEQTVVGGTGGVADRVSGRSGTTTANPARSAHGATYAVGDVVLCRRNPSDPNEYEVLDAGGGAPSAGGAGLALSRFLPNDAWPVWNGTVGLTIPFPAPAPAGGSEYLLITSLMGTAFAYSSASHPLSRFTYSLTGGISGIGAIGGGVIDSDGDDGVIAAGEFIFGDGTVLAVSRAAGEATLFGRATVQAGVTGLRLSFGVILSAGVSGPWPTFNMTFATKGCALPFKTTHGAYGETLATSYDGSRPIVGGGQQPGGLATGGDSLSLF
jgi:hypothetical protein